MLYYFVFVLGGFLGFFTAALIVAANRPDPKE
jgi:hypothetical protein